MKITVSVGITKHVPPYSFGPGLLVPWSLGPLVPLSWSPDPLSGPSLRSWLFVNGCFDIYIYRLVFVLMGWSYFLFDINVFFLIVWPQEGTRGVEPPC